jgi:hypothetical protein
MDFGLQEALMGFGGLLTERIGLKEQVERVTDSIA